LTSIKEYKYESPKQEKGADYDDEDDYYENDNFMEDDSRPYGRANVGPVACPSYLPTFCQHAIWRP